ncbi:hypothetical protein AB0O64_08475 [Streptomyces sp. NPDC088341]|uniref:hypothetical protein n=1 Tax=Streptomyces sp. NPDC088341 TaxID=3154870 RepID=UPI00341C96EF
MTAGTTAGALAAATGTAAAAPQPIGMCTTTSGVVLAVDFGHWGGPVHRSCGTTPTTGYELLNQGGWRTMGTGHDGPAFICRIGYSGHQGGKQFPTSQEEDCVLTPPASAYWSYWHADPGANTWEYSRLGAMSYQPRPGSVDLWIFGGTDIEGTEGRPTLTPDQLRARNTRPVGSGSQDKPAPRPSGTEGGEAEKPPAPAPAPAPAPSAKVPASGTPAVAPSPSTSAPMPAAPSPSSTTTSPASPSPSSAPAAPSGNGDGRGDEDEDEDEDERRVVDAAPAAEAPHDSGSTLPATVTAGLLLVIAGAAVFAANRRRRAE